MAVIDTSRPPAGGSDRALFPPRASAPLRSGTAKTRVQRRLLACVDDAEVGSNVMRHALAVAEGLGLSVTVARVLETPRHLSVPADPLEWQVRRSTCRQQLDRMLCAGDGARMESLLLAGPPASELTRWAGDHGVKLLAMGTREGSIGKLNGLGSTAQGVLDRASESVLLVPPGAAPAEGSRYRKLLVPLDGSGRAESVLPVAVRIARTHRAQIVLAHVVRGVEAAEVVDGEQARELCVRLDDHNERHARAYLEQMTDRLRKEGLGVGPIAIAWGDPRSQLRRIVIEQGADLVVLSSHGRSGLTDVPCGSVAEYLATHAPAAMLLVRPSLAQVFSASAGLDDPGLTRPIPESRA